MRYFNIVAALLLFAVYALGNVAPSERLNLWAVTFIIPLALLLNVVLVLVGLLLRKKTTIFLIAALAFGRNYIFSTIGIKSIFKRDSPADHLSSFTVLNYNVSAFNLIDDEGGANPPGQDKNTQKSEMIDWVLNFPGDVKCLQEFPHHPERDHFDLLQEIENQGKDYYFSASTNKWDSSRFGILIVSRFPIVRSGDVMASWNGYNRISYADVQTEEGIVRIINVHLQSMQIKNFHPGYTASIERGTRNLKVVLQKLKSGVFERSGQIKALVEFVKASPYPVVCAGDFNELPYSYSYQVLKKHLNNAFEESGTGFGFTYNGNTLNMLRIDNQFYSADLRPSDFQTLDTVRFSDHFPLLGAYVFR